MATTSQASLELMQTIERKQEMRVLPEPIQYAKQRMAQAAVELSKAGDMALHVELANEVLCKLVGILYQTDSDGVYANIDSATHRLLVPAPWGSAGWKKWGLRHWEATVLRGVLMGRLGQARHIPLFDYSDVHRNWFLNFASYRSIDKAHAYLKHCAVSLVEWRVCATQYHKVRLEVQSRYRQRMIEV